MRLVDFSGYVASLLVFLTFYMKDMVPLRVAALFSNVAFLVYAGALHLWPVILLHSALIPVNVCRLAAEINDVQGRRRRPVLRLSASSVGPTQDVAEPSARDSFPQPWQIHGAANGDTKASGRGPKVNN